MKLKVSESKTRKVCKFIYGVAALLSVLAGIDWLIHKDVWGLALLGIGVFFGYLVCKNNPMIDPFSE